MDAIVSLITVCPKCHEQRPPFIGRICAQCMAKPASGWVHPKRGRGYWGLYVHESYDGEYEGMPVHYGGRYYILGRQMTGIHTKDGRHAYKVVKYL